MVPLDSWSVVTVFVASVVVGRALRLSLPKAFFDVSVGVLVWAISAWAASSGLEALKYSLAQTLLFLAAIVCYVVVLGALASRGAAHARAGARPRPNVYLLALIAVGWASGLSAGWLRPYLSEALPVLVLAVIAATGLTMHSALSVASLRRGGVVALKAVAVTLASAVLAGLTVAALLGLSPHYALSVTLGLGWYSFAGPFVAQFLGPEQGFTAFLVNILREQLTFALVPVISRFRVSAISLGGATTMDNTLPVYAYVYGDDAVVPSIVHGFLLTFLVPFLEALVVRAV